MSVFDDPRVRQVSEYLYVVTTDDTYDVACWMSEHDWSWSLAIGAQGRKHLRTREEAEAFAEKDYHGPFYSAELALQDLIAHTG